MFDALPDPPGDSLFQTPAFGAALRLVGRSPITLPGGQILLRRRLCGVEFLMLPRADPPADLNAQLCAMGLGGRPLILSPERARPSGRVLRLRAPVATFDLALHTDEQSQRAALHGKWRNALRRTERGALRVRHGSLDPCDPVIAAAAAQARTRRYAAWPAGLTAAWAQVAPQQTRIFRACLRGEEIAQMVFLLHGTRASYQIGLTTDLGRATGAHTLLMWSAMRWLVRAGISRVDLGPSLPHAYGIDRFKARTGAQLRETGGTWLRWRPLARGRRP
ncbi:GNAT family N-acetyltransferase [Sulfitobacter albidus]|uniref:GNAT family N-acetyltransferase n=1 Tax=Sulfitobacter albidus TaxID=2829501 RepID=A0A975PNI8_9RHOB|nr:GNAT family N-acetyltransferase [Sulfitobacter albidus]QUJ77794.1 GNAT family N-acetyltransferase [Sulfitobacter albidus]